MKRLIAFTIMAGLMSLGAVAGQTNKPIAKTTVPPAAAARPSSNTQKPANAEHGKVKTAKKHTSKTKTNEGTAPATTPKN